VLPHLPHLLQPLQVSFIPQFRQLSLPLPDYSSGPLVLTTKFPAKSMIRHQKPSKIHGHEKTPEMAYFRGFSTLVGSD